MCHHFVTNIFSGQRNIHIYLWSQSWMIICRNKYICLGFFKYLNEFKYLPHKKQKLNQWMFEYICGPNFYLIFLQMNISVKNYLIILIYSNICHTFCYTKSVQHTRIWCSPKPFHTCIDSVQQRNWGRNCLKNNLPKLKIILTRKFIWGTFKEHV